MNMPNTCPRFGRMVLLNPVGLVGDLVQDGIARTKCSASTFLFVPLDKAYARRFREHLVARIGSYGARRDWGKGRAAPTASLSRTCTRMGLPTFHTRKGIRDHVPSS